MDNPVTINLLATYRQDVIDTFEQVEKDKGSPLTDDEKLAIYDGFIQACLLLAGELSTKIKLPYVDLVTAMSPAGS